MSFKADLKGTTLKTSKGDYIIQSFIAEGGFGEVWRAKSGDNLVAVKRLKLEYYNNTTTKNKFLQESKLSKELNHPNIVKILDWSSDLTGEIFQVLELMKCNLEEYRQKNRNMTSGDAKDLMVGVFKGLEQAHKKKIIHRDLHPGNILISFDNIGKAAIA